MKMGESFPLSSLKKLYIYKMWESSQRNTTFHVSLRHSKQFKHQSGTLDVLHAYSTVGPEL